MLRPVSNMSGSPRGLANHGAKEKSRGRLPPERKVQQSWFPRREKGATWGPPVLPPVWKSAQTASLDDRVSSSNLSSLCPPAASANSIIDPLDGVGFPSTTIFFSEFARSATICAFCQI